MTIARRAALAAVLLALPGCASAGGTNSERPYEGLAFDISEVPSALRVKEPKDLRGIQVCDLLTDAQVIELGLRAESAEVFQASATGQDCQWLWRDDHLNYASAGSATNQRDPGLPGLYLEGDLFAVFEPLVIDGYPGARTGLIDDGSCEIDIATSDDQFLVLVDNAAGRPMADPCARPRRMAELILPTLPPRR